MSVSRNRLGSILLPAALACCRQETPQAPPVAPKESLAERDRRELTLQSRRDWKPEDAPRKLTLLLVGQKTGILKGGTFRYRLELKNVGREKVVIREPSPSFIRDGVSCEAHGWTFYVTPPGKGERPLKCLSAPAAGPAAEGLDVTLQSGDYLITRRESPSEPFRELKTGFLFERPGAYRLRAVYARSGLRARSNTVIMAVGR